MNHKQETKNHKQYTLDTNPQPSQLAIQPSRDPPNPDGLTSCWSCKLVQLPRRWSSPDGSRFQGNAKHQNTKACDVVHAGADCSRGSQITNLSRYRRERLTDAACLIQGGKTNSTDAEGPAILLAAALLQQNLPHEALQSLRTFLGASPGAPTPDPTRDTLGAHVALASLLLSGASKGSQPHGEDGAWLSSLMGKGKGGRGGGGAGAGVEAERVLRRVLRMAPRHCAALGRLGSLKVSLSLHPPHTTERERGR